MKHSFSKIDYVMLILVLLNLLTTVILLPFIPETVVMHWNYSMEPDGFGSKYNFIFLAFLPVGVYFLFRFLPKIDPKKESYQIHNKAYEYIQLVIILFLIGVLVASELISLGFPISIKMSLHVLFGILFIVIGNVIGQIRPNYFLGFKTPWTLASERVWRKIHRLIGFGLMIVGILFLVLMFISQPWTLLVPLALMLIILLWGFVYSYLEYKKEIANE